MPSVLEVIFQGMCVFFPHEKHTVAALVRTVTHKPILAACGEHVLNEKVEHLCVDLDGVDLKLFDGDKKIKKAKPLRDFEGYPCLKRIPGFPATKPKSDVDDESGDLNDYICAARIVLNGGAITTQTEADHNWGLAPGGESRPGPVIELGVVRVEVVYRVELENDSVRVDRVKKGKVIGSHEIGAVNGKVRFWLGNNDVSEKRPSKAASDKPRDFDLVYDVFDLSGSPKHVKYNLVKLEEVTRVRPKPSYCIPKCIGERTLPVPCVGGCTC